MSSEYVARNENYPIEKSDRESRCRSELGEVRCQSQQTFTLPPIANGIQTCVRCKQPFHVNTADDNINNIPRNGAKPRTPSSRGSAGLCRDCVSFKPSQSVLLERTPSSRLFKSASMDWTDVGDKIETWFEKAKTPDQRVVYGFLEKINNDKELDKAIDPSHGKSLDDILDNLKKYRSRFGRNRTGKNDRFTRVFESSSWRVMRHQYTPRQFSRYNSIYGDDASRDLRMGSIFTTTQRKIGSTFLLHPGWV